MIYRLFRYYNYTISRNGQPEEHGDVFKDDYYTDLIKNDTGKVLIENKSNYNSSLHPIIIKKTNWGSGSYRGALHEPGVIDVFLNFSDSLALFTWNVSCAEKISA